MTIITPNFTAGSVSCARRRDREHRVYLAVAAGGLPAHYVKGTEIYPSAIKNEKFAVSFKFG